MQTRNCFGCRQAGHWMSDCPLKLTTDLPPPAIHCPCGGGLCEIKVSKTLENTGRRFYKCPASQSCLFFKWCDKVTDEDIRFRPAFIIPICPCGAGPCRRVKSDSGRAYLICCIKKGFGACGFFQWEDVEMPLSCDLMDEMDFWSEAGLILSDVESRYQSGGVPENSNQVAPQGKECQGSVTTEVDSMFVSDTHSATMNQDERWIKTLHGDQPTNCATSKFNLDEAMSELVGDTVCSGSIVKHEMKNHEQTGTDEGEWLQDLNEKYNSEKLHLEIVSEKHVKMLDALMSSYKKRKLLHEKACHLRNILVETEKEIASCEAETLEFGESCREVAGEMAESQKRMQEIVEKLGQEVLQQKEFVAM